MTRPSSVARADARYAGPFPIRQPHVQAVATHGRAYETLHRGTRFVTGIAASAALADPWPNGRDGQVRARFMGNCLRELDRFLDTLMEEHIGGPPVRLLSLHCTTASRLGAHASTDWDTTVDQARLRALSRSRMCLFHGGGQVRRPDSPQVRWMTAGWYGSSSVQLRRYAMGEMLRPSARDLAGIGAFYQTLADRIVGA